MAASEGLARAFKRIFDRRNSLSGNCYYYRRPTNSAYFSKFLVVDSVQYNKILLPLWCAGNVEQYIYNESDSRSTTSLQKIVVSLYAVEDLGEVKTADSMLKKFFERNSRLMKANNGKGSIYYGGPGIILDKDFNILFMALAELSYNEKNYRWKYGNILIKIDPKVFDNEQEFMNKAIIQKLIPLCGNTLTQVMPLYRADLQGSHSQSRFPIHIESLDSYIYSPPTPNPSLCTPESFQECLLGNKEEILNSI